MTKGDPNISRCDECSSLLFPLPLPSTPYSTPTNMCSRTERPLYTIPFLFPSHLTIDMKQEHVPFSLILKHLIAFHHCCVSSWLNGSQLDAQHARINTFQRLLQPSSWPQCFHTKWLESFSLLKDEGKNAMVTFVVLFDVPYTWCKDVLRCEGSWC